MVALGETARSSTAKRAAACNRAVLGVNCGHLGFMAGLEADELERLSALIEKKTIPWRSACRCVSRCFTRIGKSALIWL